MAIDKAPRRNCYALVWSYGEICVGCGCCSTDPLTMATARFDYHREQLYDALHFRQYFDDYPELAEIQRKNVALDIEYNRDRLREYARTVRQLNRKRGKT